jgi:intracellular sulfur oxidation DsrE/DsrF family protein
MSITLDGTNGITTPDVDSTTSVTTPLVTNAGTLALSATGSNIVTVSTNGSERARIDASGNFVVGGTDASFAKLSVRNGFAYINEDGSNTRQIYIRSDLSGDPAIQVATAHALKFVTTNNERARIDASGNLLVGTTSASCGGSTMRQHVSATDFVLGVTTAASGNTQAVRFAYGTTAVGSITLTGSATSYNTASDYRLKEDVQPMVGASDRLMALKPVNFAWKVDGSRVDGFLAHEAQEVVPEAVTGEKDAVDKDGKPQYQGIDQSKIVPLLVAALQEALTKIEALEARVAALETNA